MHKKANGVSFFCFFAALFFYFFRLVPFALCFSSLYLPSPPPFSHLHILPPSLPPSHTFQWDNVFSRPRLQPCPPLTNKTTACSLHRNSAFRHSFFHLHFFVCFSISLNKWLKHGLLDDNLGQPSISSSVCASARWFVPLSQFLPKAYSSKLTGTPTTSNLHGISTMHNGHPQIMHASAWKVRRISPWHCHSVLSIHPIHFALKL